MHSYYLVVYPSTIPLHYLSSNIVKKVTLHQGDQLHITDHGFYAEGKGWFILTIINQTVKVFVSFDDLEGYMDQKAVMNAADTEWKRSLWQIQVNQALAERNEEWFKFVSRKLASLQSSLSF